MEPRTDKDLLDRYVAVGDEQAFAELVARHSPTVYRTCRRFLGNDHDAEEAAQAAFLVLVRKAGSLRREGRLNGWLHRVARLVSLEALRNRATLERHQAEYALGAEIPEADQSEAAWEAVLRQVDTALDSLSAVLREAVVLRYLRGLSEQDAATQAGCPVGTMKWRASDGIAKLRVRLAKGGVTMSAAALGGLLAPEASAAVPETLLPSILATVKGFAATPAAGMGLACATLGAKEATVSIAAMLAKGAMRAMFLARVKTATLVTAAGLTAIGVGTALALSHLRKTPDEPTTVWRIESVTGAATARRGEAVRAVKTGEALCPDDTVVTASNQEVRVVSDGGDRILLREEGELVFGVRSWVFGNHASSNGGHPTLDTRHLGLGKGALVAQVRNLMGFTTPQAGIRTSGAGFFLMAAEGATTNGLPLPFTRVDVTNGTVTVRSVGSSDSGAGIALSAGRALSVGPGLGMAPMPSDGQEFSPRYGGWFQKRYADYYAAEKKMALLAKRSELASVPGEVYSAARLRERIVMSSAKGTNGIVYERNTVRFEVSGADELRAEYDLGPARSGFFRVSYGLRHLVRSADARVMFGARSAGDTLVTPVSLASMEDVKQRVRLVADVSARSGGWVRCNEDFLRVGRLPDGRGVYEVVYEIAGQMGPAFKAGWAVKTDAMTVFFVGGRDMKLEFENLTVTFASTED